MHVLFVTLTFPPDNGWGGIGTYVYHAASGLATIGHRVTVLCGIGDREYESTTGSITTVRRINARQLRAHALREQIAGLVHQLVRERSIDVVEFGEYGADGLVFQQAYPSVPTVIRLHGASRLCVLGNDPPWKRIARKFIRNAALDEVDRAERESTHRAHVVTPCSRWAGDIYRQQGWPFPKDVHVVYNPISSTELGPTSAYDSKEILFLGRVSYLKGADLIPEVMARIWRTLPDTRLQVIGQDLRKDASGSWTEWIRSRVRPAFHDKLLFSGGMPHSKVLETLRHHSLAFFASTWETFGYTHVECMQAGIACVIGSGGGAQELGEHGISTWNTRRNAAEIGDALVRMLGDPAARERIGTAARARVSSTFEAKIVARELERVYVRAVEVAGAGKK